MIDKLKEALKEQEHFCSEIRNLIYGDSYRDGRDLNKAEVNLMIFLQGHIDGLNCKMRDLLGEFDDPNNQRDRS